MEDFLIFAAVGFVAQLIDGTLGMAFGVISSTLLLGLGTPPVVASASVHAAKVFTGTASGAFHIAFGNVRKPLFAWLAAGGAIGGVAGGMLLTSVDEAAIKPWVLGWLALTGLIVLIRAERRGPSRSVGPLSAGPLGLVGGFLDALGGGGWGPTVTTTLVGLGEPPRQAVGSGSAAEAVVAAAVSTTFIITLMTGHWGNLADLHQYGYSVGGLVFGGLFAAPLAAHITSVLPVRSFARLVGVMILLLAAFQLVGPVFAR